MEQTAQTNRRIAPEFGTWPVNEVTIEQINQMKWKFDELQAWITQRTPPHNARYAAVVKTKLEEACMFAVKGFAKLPEEGQQ